MIVVVRPRQPTVVVRRQAVVVEHTSAVIVTRVTRSVVFVPPALKPKVIVKGKGLRGEAGPQNLHVGPEAPEFELPGLWVQTGLGPDGTGVTIWIEDGT